MFAANRTWTGNTNTDWTNPNNWQGGNVPTAADDFTIPSGSPNYPIITTGQTITVDNGTIQSGASFTINGGSFTMNDLTLSGTMTVNGGTFTVRKLKGQSGSTFTQTSGTVIIRDMENAAGATYNQQGGLIQLQHDWKNAGTFTATGGTVQFTGTAGAAADFSAGTNQFYNIIIDSGVNPGFDKKAGSTISISGTLTNNNAGLNIGTNATFIFNGTDQTVPSNLTYGNLQICNSPGETATASGNITVNGNLTICSGNALVVPYPYTLTVNGTITNNGSIIVQVVFYSRTNGNWNSTATWSTTGHGGSAASRVPGTVLGDSVVIGNNNTITLDLNVSNVSVRVNSSGRLNTGTFVISGSRTFELTSGGTLGIGSADGISSSGATGNIQTATRTFSTGANYVYNGSSAQVTGNGLPSTVNNLTINNSAGVSLSQSTAVNGTLTLTNGALSVGTTTLTLNSTVTATSGSITSSATGTVSYNQSSHGQSVLAANYGNLTFSNFNKTLPSSTVGIAGTFTAGSATGHTVTGNTIDFNGASQNIPSFNGSTGYNHIRTSGSGTKTIVGNIYAGGNFTNEVGVAVIVQSGRTVQIAGDVYNDGTMTNNGIFTVGN
jgi:hypothetical protein